jgi:hypothetical protein
VNELNKITKPSSSLNNSILFEMAPTRRHAVTDSENELVAMTPLTSKDVSNDLNESSLPTTTGTEMTNHPSSSLSAESAVVENTTTDDASQTNRLIRQTPDEIRSLSIDQIYLSSKQKARENHWRDNPYAAGLVEPSWREEMSRNTTDNDGDNGGGVNANGPNRKCCADAVEPEMDPTCGCLLFSGQVCGKLFNAGRVGNMAILKESHVMVDEIVAQDEENDMDGGGGDGAVMTRKVSKRQIDLVVGPYWPMMVFVTYPLIFVVSGLTAVKAVFIPNYNMVLVISWSCMTFGLCFSLFNVAFRDPGILPKYKHVPLNETRKSSWRWINSAQSYAPRYAYYDDDCAVIVEEFDHTCPWTGTAIGKKNMLAFQFFIGFLFSCLILDVILLTSSAITMP